VDVVPVPEHAESSDTASAAFEKRISEVVARLAGTAGQPQAFGKWAYWSQLHIPEYKEAASWAGKVMAIHAKSEDAAEGMNAFLGKRKPVWKT
jgi:enoyl-CoA hydratase/carnithine racemase